MTIIDMRRKTNESAASQVNMHGFQNVFFPRDHRIVLSGACLRSRMGTGATASQAAWEGRRTKDCFLSGSHHIQGQRDLHLAAH